ncbi:MAG: FHIPEP family type III secretion protein [Pyrinomonadaceae bacterium]|nr:FHIPEP family type III secretion protein [Pyrinomonadaceae bacterium]
MTAHADITVELGPAAVALAKAGGGGGGMHLADQISTRLQEWLDALNLPVDASVKLTLVDHPPGPRFIDVAVILNGVRCGFSKRQLALAYESSTGRELADHAAVLKAARQLLAEAANKDESLGLAQALLAELVVEAVKSSAERVITPEVTEAVLARARGEIARARPVLKKVIRQRRTEALLAQAREQNARARSAMRVLDRSLVTEVLRRLTRVHVEVQDTAALVQSVFRGQGEGLTAGEIAERHIDVWRPGAIEIHVDPALAKKLLKDDPVAGTPYPEGELAQEPAGLLSMMREGLFYELGVSFCSINVVVDAELPANCCRFRFHQRLTPVQRGLAEDELLVNDTPERLTAEGVPNGRPRANPANGNPCAIISQSSRHQLRAESYTWDQVEYLVVLLATELRLAASTLLSLDDVEDLLATLNSAFPALVGATLHQYSQLEVAQVLRWLLRDGVTIRDLRGVLELMLDFSYTTGVRSPTAGWEGRAPYLYVGVAEFTGEPYFTADDPYIPRFDMRGMQLFAEPAPEWIANGRINAEFVKCGMRQLVTYKVTRGPNTILCYLIDADIEKRLLAFRLAPGADSHPFSELEMAEILQGMNEGFVETYGTPVIFLATTPDVALLVQDMIAQDFPEMNVVHRQSIAESANVQPIAFVPGRDSAVPAN